MLDLPLAFDLIVATLVGLAVGLEREWSGHATGPDARFAGLRTFALLGLIGGIGGWFARLNMQVLAACVISGAILFAIVAFAMAMRRPGTTADATTEVAAIVVLVLGAAAGLGHRSVASAAAALVVVLLAEKTALQRTLKRIDAAELRATLQFAVMALVVLPLLPTGAFGPYDAFQPRQLWIVVLLFSALNFAGYIARRVIGETRGLGVTGLLGGLISSTAVTFTFSRRSREEPALGAPLALGVVAACTVLIPRVLIISTTLQPTLYPELLPILSPMLLIGLAIVAFALWRERETRPLDGPEPVTATRTVTDANDAITPPMISYDARKQNPLALGNSLRMALLFQVVLFLIAWVQATIGETGVLGTAALLGLTDMDALTLSMARLAADASQLHIAALAVGIGVLANTLLKSVVILTLGGHGFRQRAFAALMLMGIVGAAALWWRWS